MICTLCYDFLKKDDLIFDENETCFYVEFSHEILEYSRMILPKRCAETVFDLNEVSDVMCGYRYFKIDDCEWGFL